jgi:hypothetical protein
MSSRIDPLYASSLGNGCAEKTAMSPSLTASATPRPDEHCLASRTILVVISDVRLTRPSGSAASM